MTALGVIGPSALGRAHACGKLSDPRQRPGV